MQYRSACLKQFVQKNDTNKIFDTNEKSETLSMNLKRFFRDY